MKMKIDNALLRSERIKRAWSQEHLAEIAGLGLRTVQRIEKVGAGSYESIRALASALSVSVEELTDLQTTQKAMPTTSDKIRLPMRTAFVGAMIGALLAALFVANTSWAEQILLDVSISQNGNEISSGQLLTAEGKPAKMRVEDAIQVIVSPTIEDDGRVFLSATIHEFVNGQFVVLSEPRLITADDKEAEVRIVDESGDRFRVLITPHRSN